MIGKQRYKRSDTTNTRIFRLINTSTFRVDETFFADDINQLAKRVALEREISPILFWDNLNEILYVYQFDGTETTNYYGKREAIVRPIARHRNMKTMEEIRRRFWVKQ